jgi:hypothetical protein
MKSPGIIHIDDFAPRPIYIDNFSWRGIFVSLGLIPVVPEFGADECEDRFCESRVFDPGIIQAVTCRHRSDSHLRIQNLFARVTTSTVDAMFK